MASASFCWYRELTLNYSMEESAESTCDELLQRAIAIDSNNPDALRSLASCRLSQNRPDEARVAAERSWAAWKDLEPGTSK